MTRPTPATQSNAARGRPVKGRSKYRNKRCEYNGFKFHSKKELKRYQELEILEAGGHIEDICLQPSFPLFVVGKKIGTAIMDFSYHDIKSGHLVIEDVKGLDTPLSKWKRKHFEAQYGIVVEVI